MSIVISELNTAVRNKSPQEIIQKVIETDPNVFVTTRFSPYEIVLLHMLVQVRADIPVVWVDSGLNKTETYEFAETAIEQLDLNVSVYTPRMTAARFESTFGDVPSAKDEERYAEFVQQFQIEPFTRAMNAQVARVWFTGIRREQEQIPSDTEFLAKGPFGLTRVAPLLNWSEVDLKRYVQKFQLQNELTFFDPSNHKEACLFEPLKVA